MVKAKKGAENNEFSVIKTGGKQYLVSVGDVISVEKLKAEVGEKVTFDGVLLHDNGTETLVGEPIVEGKKVVATVLEQGKGEKITVVHYKAKSRYFKRNGHRQLFTKIQIETV
jgi:large subunit ribosomal protein L21